VKEAVTAGYHQTRALDIHRRDVLWSL